MKDLTSLQVRALREPGQHRAARLLYCQVTARGDGDGVTKSWLLRYVSPVTGRPAVMGLGSVEDVTLATAREIATQARELIKARGLDPLMEREREREQRRVDASKHKTFGEVVAAYLAAHAHDWKNAKHAAQWESTLKNDARLLTPLPVASIGTQHVLDVLQPIWRTKPETASRLRGRVERVLSFALAAGYRKREDGNPATWSGHLQELLGSKAKAQKAKRAKTGRGEHHPAMPYAELPPFMERVRSNQAMSARAMEFTTLTAARTNETIGARWADIDLDAKVWTIPAHKMKMDRPHRVPLSDRAVAILAKLPREKSNDHVFLGAKAGQGLSNMAMLELLRGMCPDSRFTVHGFRSSFRDWCRERTSYPREIVELALAHQVGDGTEQAYARGDALDKRRPVMAAWAKYCESAPTKQIAGNVISLQSA